MLSSHEQDLFAFVTSNLVIQCLPAGPGFDEVLLVEDERIYDAPPVVFFIT